MSVFDVWVSIASDLFALGSVDLYNTDLHPASQNYEVFFTEISLIKDRFTSLLKLIAHIHDDFKKIPSREEIELLLEKLQLLYDWQEPFLHLPIVPLVPRLPQQGYLIL